ncbi:MAG: GNAT family N-acetyltransferase [Spirochaetales bacterium]
MDIRWYESMRGIPADQWNRLAKPLATPLLEWEWLNVLEDSGSIAPQEGWHPHHITVWDADTLVAAAPLYIKTHSMGEFVFDFAWADVAHQIGARYYPKLVGMSPATPSDAFQIMTDPNRSDREELFKTVVDATISFAQEQGLGGVAFNFIEPDLKPSFENRGFIAWRHQSYEWINDGFSSFDDYLAGFTKNQRRNIRRERRSMEREGVDIRVLQGQELTHALFRRMSAYYELHNAQFGPWAAKFLNDQFFEQLGEVFRDRLAFVCAYHPSFSTDRDKPVAMAFLVVKGDLMLGRYWGAAEHIPDLHFNVCYYTPIEWAIEHGYRRFDPGMGSSHKVRRGFRAKSSYSMHRFLDERMYEIMVANIDRINSMENLHIGQLNAARPIKASKTGEAS